LGRRSDLGPNYRAVAGPTVLGVAPAKVLQLVGSLRRSTEMLVSRSKKGHDHSYDLTMYRVDGG
jgi:hypothetical protein